MTRLMSRSANICITVHGNSYELKFELSIIYVLISFSKIVVIYVEPWWDFSFDGENLIRGLVVFIKVCSPIMQ